VKTVCADEPNATATQVLFNLNRETADHGWWLVAFTEKYGDLTSWSPSILKHASDGTNPSVTGGQPA
jgi:hypothetical protein